jgi:hypothetical protein
MTSPMPDVPEDCGHSWMSKQEALQGCGPHTCIEPLGHDLDPTWAEHKCQCGETT